MRSVVEPSDVVPGQLEIGCGVAIHARNDTGAGAIGACLPPPEASVLYRTTFSNHRSIGFGQDRRVRDRRRPARGLIEEER